MNKNYFATLTLLIVSISLQAQSWFPVNTGLPALTARGLAKVDDTLFVGIEDGGFFYSVDNGDSWSTNAVTSDMISEGLNKFFGSNIDMGVPGGYFFAYGQGVLEYYEQGLFGVQSLDAVVASLPNQGILSFTRVQNPSRAFYGTEGGLFYTENGAPFEPIEATGLTGDALTINAVFDNDLQILLGTNAGVYSSDDNGTSFTLNDLSIPATERVYEISSFTPTSNAVYFLDPEGPSFLPLVTGGDYRCTFWDATGTGDAFFFGDNVGNRFNLQTFEAAPLALDGISGGIILSTVVIGDYVFVCTEEGGVFRYDLTATPVGLDAQDNSPSNIAIFPNPNNGTFSITGLTQGNYTIEVLDLAGRIVQSLGSCIQSSCVNIDLSTAKNGVYLVRTTTANGGFSVNKMVIAN
jgi:hypothetical protein